MTIFIALTGGIACGKSQATARLRERGIPVIDCDELAREVVEPGTLALRLIIRRFQAAVEASGDTILLPDGTLNRKALGAVVFADSKMRHALNGITGPAILFALGRNMLWHFVLGTPIVVIDAPTLYESGGHIAKFTALVVLVVADPAVQLQRILERDELPEEQAKQRIASQLPLEVKRAKANVVLDNNGTRDDFLKDVDRLIDTVVAKYGTWQYRLWSAPGLTCLAGFAWLCWRAKAGPHHILIF